MRRLSVVLGAALLAASIGSPAWGKGPVKATLTGPGLGEPVTFGGGERAGSDVMVLAEHSGLFPALFSESPSPLKERRPAEELGPRYTVSYAIPSPEGGAARVIQYVYPYARGGPVTHTPPDQPFFEGEGPDGGPILTGGGWYEAPSLLKSTLISAGLPSKAPGSGAGPGAGASGAVTVWVAAGAILVLGAALTLVAMRRRSSLSTQEGAA